MPISAELDAHLKSGATTLCRAWALTPKTGATLGFTDHDMPLEFDGITFRADAGLSAGALQHATGLAVDNTEAVGLLSDISIREEDLLAGHFDGADVVSWLVNWRDVSQRVVQFRGSLGEITRANGAFTAELRGLTEALNQSKGRAYQRTSIPSDGACGFDPLAPGFFYEGAVDAVEDRLVFRFNGLTSYDERWFDGGRFTVLTGAAAGLIGHIKSDRIIDGDRIVELWARLRATVATGDQIRLEPGCNKSAEQFLETFGNLVDFRGFPHIPGEDWLTSYPSERVPLDGGSLFR